MNNAPPNPLASADYLAKQAVDTYVTSYSRLVSAYLDRLRNQNVDVDRLPGSQVAGCQKWNFKAN